MRSDRLFILGSAIRWDLSDARISVLPFVLSHYSRAEDFTKLRRLDYVSHLGYKGCGEDQNIRIARKIEAVHNLAAVESEGIRIGMD